MCKPPSADAATYRAWSRSPYGQAMRAAEASRREWAERAARQTQAHFMQHPHCRQRVADVAWDGTVKRDAATSIRWQVRMSPAWWQAGHFWEDDQPAIKRPLEGTVFEGLARASHTHKPTR